MVKFNASKADRAKITIAAMRAVRLAKPHFKYELMDAEMDLHATHCNGNRMDFDKLLAADDFNFMHDAFGIRRHIDRGTGKLTDCFVPRCSAREKAAA